ncbi:2Fe-2S iron-sulfur cluster binding domain-containing protein [Sneathiella chungangensis]|uniref:2Fe-2S iron-sulfur cluster binding domain-containing protein n=1 Tax=Sneathiella chungangensis TaxID=1418234 RepID=A0A845MNH9_9PROT|nr:FAD-binding oxidoreductase [Sneathiella chungangensis]MZR24346.1 2Fe-2S iron-sulfur cluster binding domain-containing protein [Sneathiella chungangensis]
MNTNQEKMELQSEGQLFVLHRVDDPSKSLRRHELRSAHLDYLAEFEAHILMAGAYVDEETGDELGSHYLLRFTSEREARKFVDGDPFVMEGLFADLDLNRCEMRLGSLLSEQASPQSVNKLAEPTSNRAQGEPLGKGESAKVTLEFSDGETAMVPIDAGTSIMEGMRQAGISMAYDCRQGQCQTCKCDLDDGNVSYPEGHDITLSESERAGGAALPCVARPATTTLKLRAPYDRSKLLPIKNKKVEVVAIEKLSETVIGLKCKYSPAVKINFLPGQYIRIKIPGTGEDRCFSFATALEDWPHLGFLIRMLPNGKMSNYLKRLKSGDKITIQGPYGSFYLRDRPGRIVMVAGGTGLAPMLSMLKTLEYRGDTERDMVLCFGVTNPGDAFMLSELADLRDVFSNIDVRLSMMNADKSWPHAAGTAVDLLYGSDADGLSDDDAAYLCGPPIMVEAAKDKLASMGFKPDQIVCEEFIPSGILADS